MAFKNNIYGYGGVMIYKSTLNIDDVFNDPESFFKGNDTVWSMLWKGSNPKNKFVEYECEHVFARKRRTYIDEIEQSLEVYGFDTQDNNYSNIRKLQNLLSWAVKESRKSNGGYLMVCPRYDFGGYSAPNAENFFKNIFFGCEISGGYQAEDVGNTGSAEDFKIVFNVIDKKEDIDVPTVLGFFSLEITSNGSTLPCIITSGGVEHKAIIIA